MGGSGAVRDETAILLSRNNLLQLIHLRWIAFAGQFATILGVVLLLGVRLPLVEMLIALTLLGVFNLASWIRFRATVREIANGELFIGLLVDLLLLTVLLYYSGGITNPFIYLYLLQIAVGAVLLKPRYIWLFVILAVACFLWLIQWNLPLILPELSGISLPSHYIGGLLICFILNAVLLVIFIHRISTNLRQRDARLADLRQRAAEQQHIVRMGLLASGAAHELGTPLATMSVILGDWSYSAPIVGDAVMIDEIKLMQLQLQRCKTIVSGILMSAGESRHETTVLTTLHVFFDQLVDEWRSTRPSQLLEYDRSDLQNTPVISDSALKQVIGNILDNGVEAAPLGSLQLIVTSTEQWLTICIRDVGPGFSPDILVNFAKPYHSTKDRPGSGLGLFLSANVVRTLGGTIEASNLTPGGAEVLIKLPLTSLTRHERDDHGN
jgi:two-component system sensor histidine kinase RegB